MAGRKEKRIADYINKNVFVSLANELSITFFSFMKAYIFAALVKHR